MLTKAKKLQLLITCVRNHARNSAVVVPAYDVMRRFSSPPFLLLPVLISRYCYAFATNFIVAVSCVSLLAQILFTVNDSGSVLFRAETREETEFFFHFGERRNSWPGASYRCD
ncbi:hypothetical protein EVAR_14034_1 [Eumeta japonica]|uniref:Uncharacterized protein n=1 Tax=Eumeta variegata TaxID=151549 RepID=A0A4C1SQI5_EUMVA|nr:hypothetical protein EVAR_14034_1 [Eumeta japonica]